MARKLPRGGDGEDKGKVKTNMFLLLMILGGGLSATLPLIDLLLDFFGDNGFTYLKSSDPALSKVFFGGHPWIILCQNSTAVTPRVWDDAASKHVKSETYDAFSMGVLDCAEPLPSGKTTYERFKLTPPVANIYTEARHAFVVANGKTPTKFIPDNMINVQKPGLAQVNRLVEYVKTESRQVARLALGNSDLQSRCLSKKWCGVVLNKDKLNDDQNEILESLMTSQRLVSWVRIPTAKRQFSLEKSLRPIAELTEEQSSAEPRLLLLARSSASSSDGKKIFTTSAKAHKGRFGFREMDIFIDECMNATGTSTMEMKPLKKKPTVSKRSAKKAKKTKSKAKKENKQKVEEDPEARAERIKKKQERMKAKAEKKKEARKARDAAKAAKANEAEKAKSRRREATGTRAERKEITDEEEDDEVVHRSWKEEEEEDETIELDEDEEDDEDDDEDGEGEDEDVEELD